MASSIFTSQAVKLNRLILASILLHSFALVNRHVQSRHRAHRQIALLRLQSIDSSQKTPESNFWFASTQKNATGGVPAIPQLVHETGYLPPGAYCSSGSTDSKASASPCLIAIGIQPPLNADGEHVWREGVKNCQKLIDSGFNTFRVNDCHDENEDSKSKSHTNKRSKRRKSPSSIALEQFMHDTLRTEIRHQAETKFYDTLRKSTPPSVLRSCFFMTNLEIPSILSEDTVIAGSSKDASPVPYGNGWMVRESISETLLRTKGECLDSVVLEYRKNSPYHLDTLDTLFDMKREGLIQSISTKNFPPLLLDSAFGCGFNVFSNDVYGNLMNTNNLEPNSEVGVLCGEYGCSHLVSAPLGGGIFTDQFCQFKEWAQLSAPSKKLFNTLLDLCCKVQNGTELDKWKNYRAIIETVEYIALKYQVSVESIALRWLLQLNDGISISVGTHLGMDFFEEKGGQPYSRHRDFRQVFTFSLEEDDMKRLCQVAGFTSD
eukprot:CAMPEP_0181086678 /NCGR_PEP_ID=MMETSP1071-20121207/5874_1 /TAXON_ID=35127 /ORGANISM="Thalassiosira sp., Strain NH16" /LENGTH=489 /DNA_ID=CAMNT_0023168529 /DNA_START=62 /DNA_END=1528 /DNA_ORIENTATION=+